MSVRAVPNEVDFAALELQVAERWQTEGTFEQSLARRVGCPTYVFYDGPPFATGLPHYGHILTSYIKDVVPRFFTMRGFHVPRRWGWDCHGLPVEFEVEKELGFKARSEILDFGIGPFNEACRSVVLRYTSEWRTIITRLGRWVDFNNDYKTMDPEYMESVVWAFKTLWQRDLVYEGQKVVAYCPRCQTPLSNFEARLDDSFRSRVDPAVAIRFRLCHDRSQFLLAWTTTPWTLPSNVAIAVAPSVEYVRMQRGGESVWVAANAVSRFRRELDGHNEVERRAGSDLLGLRYEPVFAYFGDTENAFHVLEGDFVSTDEGTGLVHLAPAFGEEDAAACVKAGITGPNPVLDDGTFDSTVPDFAGLNVLEANEPIIARLRSEGALFRRDQHTHNYPHCWRCDSPLLYRAITTWFIKVTELKVDLARVNQQISWTPEHVRDGRFGKWLDGARDWAVSRNRFWGAPVPVWRCNSCRVIDVIGGRQELESKSGMSVADWHRPTIDDIRWPCPCGGHMERVPDVLDCWFESGAMPYAQVHYPFEHKAEFEATFPADFVVEYIAQTRGWFYTLVVEAAALFHDRPFKNVICHGVILAEDGRKMSKRLKNYPDPMQLVDAHGSDALRIALLSSSLTKGADICFSATSVRDAVRRVCIPLWNCVHFYTTHAEIERFEASGHIPAPTRLDRYLLSETDRLRRDTEVAMEAYDLAACYEAIEAYVVMLSTWYLRLSKRRFWEPESSNDKRSAFEVLYAALSTLAPLVAPFLPFLSESIHRAIGGGHSVHLEDWPKERLGWRDDELANEMKTVRTLARLTRNVREVHRISHRQPLQSIAVANVSQSAINASLDFLLDELNVKEITILSSLEGHAVSRVVLDYARLGKRLRDGVKDVRLAIDSGNYEISSDGSLLCAAGFQLGRDDFSMHYSPSEEGRGVATDGRMIVLVDVTIYPALLGERYARDLNRGVQDLRKQAGLSYHERIRVGIVTTAALVAQIESRFGWLLGETLANELVLHELPSILVRKTMQIGGEPVEIMLNRA